jgi:hypothetical protein
MERVHGIYRDMRLLVKRWHRREKRMRFIPRRRNLEAEM